MKDSDDLLVLARRRALSDAERRRLRDVLSSSEEARWLDAAGRGFDAEAPIMAGDDALIEQMVQRVERGKRATRGRGRFRFGRWLAVGLLAAGVSVAAVKLAPSLFGTSSEQAPEASSKVPVAGHGAPTSVAREVTVPTNEVVELPASAPVTAASPPPHELRAGIVLLI